MTEFLIALIVTGCLCSGLVMRYIPFRSIANTQTKKKLFLLYGLSCLGNITIATLVFHLWGITQIVPYLHTGGSLFAIFVTLINIRLLPGRTGEHLFTLGMSRTLHFLMLSIPAYIISLQPQLDPVWQLIQLLGLYSILILITHYPLQQLLRHTIEPFLKLESEEYWKTIFFIPLAFFAAAAIMVWGTDTVNPLLQLISSLVSSGMLILMCKSIQADHKRVERNLQMEKQLEYQRLHYTELRVRVEDARKLNHNLKHHIAAIRGYMDADDKEGLDRYCHELVSRIGSSTDVPYTGNAAVDGVLYHYIQKAKQENIDFKFTGTIHSPGIADIDLCAALGNALDNAIFGCKTLSDNRHIALLCQSEKALLTIVVRNSFDGIIEKDKTRILSRKRANQAGVGLASMEAMCQRYGGSFQTSWDENSFTIMFLFPLNE